MPKPQRPHRPNPDDMEQDDIVLFREIHDLLNQFVAAMEKHLSDLSFHYTLEDNIRQSLVDVLADCGVPAPERIEIDVEQARIAYQEAMQDDYDEQRAEHRREMRELDL